MEKIKLIEVLKTFSSEELTGFEKFISSPFHNKGRNLVPYFKILKKFHPEYLADKMEIFKLNYPGKKYDDSVMRRLNSYLLSMAEEFLVQLSLEEKKTEKDLYCLEQYLKRGLSNEFILKSGRIKKELTSSNFPLEKFFLLSISYHYITGSFYIDKSEHKNFITHTLDYTESGILFLIIRMIRNNIIKDNSTKNTSKELSSALTEYISDRLNMERIFEILKKNDLVDKRIYTVLYYHYKCFLEKDNTGHYENLKKEFLANISLFSKEDKYYMFNDMLSWCILKFQDGNSGFVREELNLIKLMLEHDALTASDKEPMKVIFFRNVLFTAFDLKETGWTENFVEATINKLSPEFRENMRYYSFIYIEYYKKNFEKCLEYFSHLKMDNFIFKRDTRILMLKVYYELGYIEPAIYLLDSTKHYLSGSREISEKNKTRDSNFTKFYTKLLKITDNTDAAEIDFLKKNVLREANIESRNWLIRKIEEKGRN